MLRRSRDSSQHWRRRVSWKPHRADQHWQDRVIDRGIVATCWPSRFEQSSFEILSHDLLLYTFYDTVSLYWETAPNFKMKNWNEHAVYIVYTKGISPLRRSRRGVVRQKWKIMSPEFLKLGAPGARGHFQTRWFTYFFHFCDIVPPRRLRCTPVDYRENRLVISQVWRKEVE